MVQQTCCAAYCKSAVSGAACLRAAALAPAAPTVRVKVAAHAGHESYQCKGLPGPCDLLLALALEPARDFVPSSSCSYSCACSVVLLPFRALAPRPAGAGEAMQSTDQACDPTNTLINRLLLVLQLTPLRRGLRGSRWTWRAQRQQRYTAQQSTAQASSVI